jgi:O-antigen/teichoic acid export membrane protein
MLIDRTQRGWGLGSLVIFAAALVIYFLEAWIAPQGPRGGSAIGLIFGVVGFGFMIFAAALGARKRVPTWRIGRAKAWMRGHLWLGLLSLPLVLFHGGFHFGGTLTRVLMWLLIATVASGVYGAVRTAPWNRSAATWDLRRMFPGKFNALEDLPRCGRLRQALRRCALRLR